MTDIPPQDPQFSADPVTAPDTGHAISVMLEQAQQVVRMLRAFAATDRTVDLVGLEHLVGVLCAQTLDLPPAEGRLFRPSLEGLLAECDALGSILRHPSLPRQKAALCPSHLRPS